MATTNYNVLRPAGYQAISATSSTAVGVTVPTAAVNQTTANYVFFVAENAVRWRDDGTDPVNAVSGGAPLGAGQGFSYDGDLRAIKFISQAGTATVHANYYRAA